jgi:hypothetical protein
VEIIWVPAVDPATGREGKVIEACGTPGNLEMAAWVHAFVKATAWRLWKAHKLRAGVRGDRERERFVAGAVKGLADKLAEGAQVCREEGLVWLGDPGVQDYLRKRHPRVRMLRFGGGVRTDTFEHGRAAGRDIVLHRPVTEGPSGVVKRLTGGGSAT